ncbi:MAG: VOC family protein [Acidimicrobiales bacterium]|nr:VOC family protein [Acidimicrobiales bacterium]
MTALPEITKVQLVTIPSSDQTRSVAFYQSLGFEKRVDFPWVDGAQWVELYPPGDDAGLAIVPHGPDPVGVRTGVILNTPDIDATHAAMRGLGVDVDDVIARAGSPARVRIGAVEVAEPVPPMFWFRDVDGNELLMVEAG